MSRETIRNQEATVYVGNVDPQVDEALLYQLMIQAGPVHSVSMPVDKITQEHQQFAFVTFKNPSDSDYASQILNGIKMYGKQIRVNKASQSSVNGESGLDLGANIFVGNLDPAVTEAMLETTFQKFGRLVKRPEIKYDDEGNSKGVGFVYFDSFESSDKAIESMNNQYLMNRHCRVEYAFKKNGKERHGDQAERTMAAQARKNRVPLA